MNHYVGNVYRQTEVADSEEYILAMTDAHSGVNMQIALIGTRCGNRWRAPYLFSTENRGGDTITDEEFQVNVGAKNRFELVRFGPAAEYARQQGQLKWIQAL
jgi:hypothetical protein